MGKGMQRAVHLGSKCSPKLQSGDQCLEVLCSHECKVLTGWTALAIQGVPTLVPANQGIEGADARLVPPCLPGVCTSVGRLALLSVIFVHEQGDHPREEAIDEARCVAESLSND